VANDEERRFRLWPRKPAARTERIALASAYKTIMHYASMTSRGRRSGGQLSGRTRPHSSDAMCVLLTRQIQPEVSGYPWTLRARESATHEGDPTAVGSMPLKNQSTSQRGLTVAKRPTINGFGS
jgi:hypothetical protein